MLFLERMYIPRKIGLPINNHSKQPPMDEGVDSILANCFARPFICDLISRTTVQSSRATRLFTRLACQPANSRVCHVTPVRIDTDRPLRLIMLLLRLTGWKMGAKRVCKYVRWHNNVSGIFAQFLVNNNSGSLCVLAWAVFCMHIA